MHKRTESEISGHIREPSIWEKMKYMLQVQFSLESDKSIMMDQRCYELAKSKIVSKSLDIKYIALQVRENQQLKQMLFNKQQMARLGDCYKNVIDPRKGFDAGV